MCVLKMWLVLENSGAGKTRKCVWGQGLYVNVSSWRLTDPRLLKQPKICRAMVWSWWICTEAFLCTGYEGQSEDDEDIYAEGGLCFLLLKNLDFSRFFNILIPVSQLFSSNVDNRLEQQPNCVWNNIKVVVQNSLVYIKKNFPKSCYLLF